MNITNTILASTAVYLAIYLVWNRIKPKAITKNPPFKWLVHTDNREQLAEKYDRMKNALAAQNSAKLQSVQLWQYVESILPDSVRNANRGRTMEIVWEYSTPYIAFKD